nr:ribosome biogenesis GTPase Der [Rhodovibrio sodomensis]
MTVAIVGRPNVGKSTLFNRLTGRRTALVDDTPGVTRDRREGEGALFDLTFRLFDTAGLEDVDDDSLEARMRRQSEIAIQEADVVLMMLDARAGVTATDEIFADKLRRGDKPVLVLANKCEGQAGQAGLAEAFTLGLGDPVAFSAEHGIGLEEVHELLSEVAQATGQAEEPAADVGAHGQGADGEGAQAEADGEDAQPAVDVGPLRLAIVGRPNAGKSTLVNRLLGEERLLTGPEAGITRDSIAVDWVYKDRAIKLVDTAGLRRKSRVDAKLEKLAVADALRAVQFAHVVVLVIDGEQGLDKQDLTIANQTIQEGRGLVLALNKWDAIGDRDAARKAVSDRLTRSLPQVKGVPVVPVSGLKGTGMENLLDQVMRVYDLWNRKFATPDLNHWLSEVEAANPPPSVGGKRCRLKYISQPKARPPTFVLFCSRPKDLSDAYLRYLENELRHDFDLPAVPVRFQLKKSKNPYA